MVGALTRAFARRRRAPQGPPQPRFQVQRRATQHSRCRLLCAAAVSAGADRGSPGWAQFYLQSSYTLAAWAWRYALLSREPAKSSSHDPHSGQWTARAACRCAQKSSPSAGLHNQPVALWRLRRSWEFAVALLLMDLYPDSLLLVSVYGIADNVVRVLLGSFLGSYIARYSQATDTGRLIISNSTCSHATEAARLSHEPSTAASIVLHAPAPGDIALLPILAMQGGVPSWMHGCVLLSDVPCVNGAACRQRIIPAATLMYLIQNVCIGTSAVSALLLLAPDLLPDMLPNVQQVSTRPSCCL